MADQGGTWAFKGVHKRALELPDGSPVDVAPQGRARLRYNESTNTLQLSRDTGPYEDLATGSSSTLERLAYGSMPLTLGNTTAPLTLGDLSDNALSFGGEELYSNFATYTRSQFRIVLGNGTIYDPLTFSSLNDVVSWVNTNIPQALGRFTTQSRLFCYDLIDESIHPISLAFGRNANLARLKNRYWNATGSDNAVVLSRWAQSSDGDLSLYNLWNLVFGAPLAALPWTDNERKCFWLSRNGKRLYDFPNQAALTALKIPGSGIRYMQQVGTGNRVSANGNFFSWPERDVGYVAVAPDGSYYNVINKASSFRYIPSYLSTGHSILAGIPLEDIAGDRAMLLKPIGIDQIYFQYTNPSLYRIEVVAGSDRDLTRRMRVLAPTYNSPGQYSGPCTINQWWDACTRAPGAYHGHGPGLGSAAFQLRDLSTNHVSPLSTAQIKWLRRYRGRPLACVVGNKP